MTGAPPLPYFELNNTVEDYLTKCSKLRGWAIDASDEGEANKISVFPFARNGDVGAKLTYECSEHHVKGSCCISSKTSSLTSLLPTVEWTKKLGKGTHVMEVNGSQKAATYSFANPALFSTIVGHFNEGSTFLTSATTRVAKNAYVGGLISYDPWRSGLKDATCIAVQKDCPNFCGGDLLAKYNLSRGLSLQLRFPVHTFVDVAVIGERDRFIAGVQGRSPCGARIMAAANVSDGTLIFTSIRNAKDIWKIALTYSMPVTDSSRAAMGSAPRFGIQFTNQDAPL